MFLAKAETAKDLPETCYLFTFFYHHTAGEGLHLAWSRDGFSWEILGGDQPYLRPVVGEGKLLRDPCLYRGPDGVYRLVWTTSWKGKTIGYASSRDLIHWSEQKAIPVMEQEPATQNCWAPEVVWDDAKQHFLIFWSSTVLGQFRETENSNKGPTTNHRIYATTTKDFIHFTPTTLLYDGGFNVIDATLARDGERWLMFVKNETATPTLEKNIRLVRAETPEGPFSAASPAITGRYWAEGPSAIKVGDVWRVYFDKHRENKYGVIVSRDLAHWTDLSEKTSFPKNARHGTVLAVPRALIETLLQTAPTQEPGLGSAK
ncbi:MAG: glycoside hydrolase family 43 protein [Nibricoccus sp.]